jgi:tryptophan synthase alpha subunit
VVGSALVERIAAADSPRAAIEAASRFVRELKAPLRA